MKTKPIAIGAAIGLGVLFLITKTKSVFSPLIYNQKIRGNDVHGSGAYGASRGDKIHNGEDIIAQPGQAIKAPIDCKILRYSDPYGDRAYSGYWLTTPKYLIKIWYVAPNKPEGVMVKAGEIIGYAQNIAARYPGITPHVHIEVWDRSKNNVSIDPTTLF